MVYVVEIHNNNTLFFFQINVCECTDAINFMQSNLWRIGLYIIFIHFLVGISIVI